jgi:hypothetical protein
MPDISSYTQILPDMPDISRYVQIHPVIPTTCRYAQICLDIRQQRRDRTGPC